MNRSRSCTPCRDRIRPGFPMPAQFTARRSGPAAVARRTASATSSALVTSPDAAVTPAGGGPATVPAPGEVEADHRDPGVGQRPRRRGAQSRCGARDDGGCSVDLHAGTPCRRADEGHRVRIGPAAGRPSGAPVRDPPAGSRRRGVRRWAPVRQVRYRPFPDRPKAREVSDVPAAQADPAVSDSTAVRNVVSKAPLTSAVVDRFVPGETTAEAVRGSGGAAGRRAAASPSTTSARTPPTRAPRTPPCAPTWS